MGVELPASPLVIFSNFNLSHFRISRLLGYYLLTVTPTFQSLINSYLFPMFLENPHSEIALDDTAKNDELCGFDKTPGP